MGLRVLSEDLAALATGNLTTFARARAVERTSLSENLLLPIAWPDSRTKPKPCGCRHCENVSFMYTPPLLNNMCVNDVWFGLSLRLYGFIKVGRALPLRVGWLGEDVWKNILAFEHVYTLGNMHA